MADALKAQGNKAFTSGQFAEAVDLFTQAIAVDPANHVLYSNRSAAYASQHKYAEALADAEKTVSLKPDWGKGYSRLGAAHHGAGNLEAARDAYERGLKVDPANAQLSKGLAEVKQQADSPAMDPFAALLNEGIWAKIAANPKLSPYLADQDFVGKLKFLVANPQQGMNMMNDQRILMTLITLMGVNVASPEDVLGKDGARQAQDELDREAFDAGMPGARAPRSRSPSPARDASVPKRSPSPAKKKAAEAAEPMEVVEPEEPSEEEKARKAMLAEKELGNAAYKKRDFDAALQHYGKAWELSGEKEVTVLTNQAAVHFELQNFDECIALCEKAVDLGREQRADFKLIARALGRIGTSHAQKGDLDLAIKYFEKSLTEHRTPDILTKLRDAEKLREQKKKEAYHSPQLADEARDRGNELFKGQKFAEAIKEYTEAIARNEADARAYSNRAACYHKLGAIPEALKDCDAAIARDPQFVKAYLRKAAIQHFTRDYNKCLETCDKAAAADTEGKHQGEIQAQMQKAYFAMQSAASSGDPKAREEHLRKAMQDPEVAEILQDPVMNQILSQMQSDPKATREHLANPQVAAKIRKLMAAGVISTR